MADAVVNRKKTVARVRRRVPTEEQMIRREAKHLRRISRITKSERLQRLRSLRLTASSRLTSQRAGD